MCFTYHDVKKNLFLLLLLLFCANAYAQHQTNFEISLSETKVNHSLYNSIKFADTRKETGSFGFVQTGVSNRIAKVVSPAPFSEEINRVLASLTDSTSAKGELFLQIRKLNFAEVTGAMGEKGYCAMQAEMYVKNEAGYQKINSLDTLIHLRATLDVTNSILRGGSSRLTAFIRESLLATPAIDARVYTYSDVIHIDSIEKTAIPLYSNNTYVNGLYLTYQSFKNQVPDKQGVTVENDYVYQGYVKAPDEKGKMKDVKLKKTYAIVYKGLPYIVTEFGFYPLNKVGKEFTFTGKAKTPPNNASLMMTYAMFGVVGALMANSGDEGTFEMQVDHKNGSIIKLKEIPVPKAESGSRNDGWD